MKTLINKIKALQNDGVGPCNKSIEFLESCKTPQEALEKATWDYLEWLLSALKVDFNKERADYRSKFEVLGPDYHSKLDALLTDYWSKRDIISTDYNSKVDALRTKYANSLRKLVPASFFS